MEKMQKYYYTLYELKQNSFNEIFCDICNLLKNRTNLKKNYIVYISALLYIKYIKNIKKDAITSFERIYHERLNYYIGDIIDEEIGKLRYDTENKYLFCNVEFKKLEIHREMGEESPLSLIIECINIVGEKLRLYTKPVSTFLAEAYEFALKECIKKGDIIIEQKEFYTPQNITDMVANMVINNNYKNVYDPYCGSANFLVSCFNKMQSLELIGEEEDIDIYNICMTKLLLNNLDNNNIIYKNSNINKFKYNKYDIILTNPPFAQKKWTENMPEEDIRYIERYGLPTTAVADYAYLLKMLKSLSDNGKMGIILPHGVLFRENEKIVRENLVKGHHIEAIIGLPENLFYNTRMSVVLLIISKIRNDDTVLFVDTSKEYSSDGKNNYLRDETINKIIDIYQNKKEVQGYSHIASIEEIEKNEFNLTIKRYVKEKRIEKIKIKKQEIMDELAELEAEIGILEENMNDVLETLGIEEIFHKNNINDEEKSKKRKGVDYQKIGENIKIARREKMYSQEQLAEKMDVSVAYISRVERGITKINLKRLSEICEILDISISEMLTFN